MICARRLRSYVDGDGAISITSRVASPILNHWRFRLQLSYVSATVPVSVRLNLQILPQFVGQQSTEAAQ
jgi:hypothetical protein